MIDLAPVVFVTVWAFLSPNFAVSNIATQAECERLSQIVTDVPTHQCVPYQTIIPAPKTFDRQVSR